MRKNTAADFWARVAVASGCWEWQGARIDSGYGVTRWAGRQIGAHRVAWMITHGPIPTGMFVCHTCDNPPCVNPSHLFLGTNMDNQRDAATKGRSSDGPSPTAVRRAVARLATHPELRARGERSGRAVLTEAAVQDIRLRASDGPFGVKARLAREYGVSDSLITAIVQRLVWRHVA